MGPRNRQNMVKLYVSLILDRCFEQVRAVVTSLTQGQIWRGNMFPSRLWSEGCSETYSDYPKRDTPLLYLNLTGSSEPEAKNLCFPGNLPWDLLELHFSRPT